MSSVYVCGAGGRGVYARAIMICGCLISTLHTPGFCVQSVVVSASWALRDDAEEGEGEGEGAWRVNMELVGETCSLETSL